MKTALKYILNLELSILLLSGVLFFPACGNQGVIEEGPSNNITSGCVGDDCSESCGNGQVDEGEICDGDCPFTCDDGDPCTTDSLTGSATTCDATCTHEDIAACLDLPRQWHAPESRANSGWGTLLGNNNNQDDRHSDLGHDGQGNAIAVSVESDGNGRRLAVKHYAEGQDWGAVIFVDSGDSQSEMKRPRIAVQSAGNAMAVWQKRTAPNYKDEVWTSRYASGGSWSSPQRLDQSGLWAGYPKVSMDDAGNAMAIWRQGITPPTVGPHYDNLYASVYTASSGQWGPPQALGLAAAPSGVTGLNTAFDLHNDQPALVMNGSGTAVVVWRLYLREDTILTDTWFELYARRYEPGSGWSSIHEIQADIGDRDVHRPEVVLDATGEATIVYHRVKWSGSILSTSEQDHESVSIRLTAAGNLESEKVLSTCHVEKDGDIPNPDPCWINNHSLSINSSGQRAVAVNRRNQTPKERVWVYTAPGPNFDWTLSARVDSALTSTIYSAQVGIDENGNLLTLWNEGGLELKSSYKPAAGSWSSPVSLTASPTNIRQPRFSLAPNGDAIALWTGSGIWSALFE